MILKKVSFYLRLGFKIEYERTDFAFLSLGNAQLMIEQINNHWFVDKLEKPFGRGINFQIEISSIKELLERLNGYPLFREVEDHWYRQNNKLLGQRELLIQDPDGYLLRFSEDIGVKDIE